MMKRLALFWLILIFTVSGQTAFDYPPLNYASTPMENEIETLIKQIESGSISLKKDPVHGYLPDVLKALKIPVSSQLLVFSKTSFQKALINRQEPRAVYFNESNFVGKVQNSNLLELAAYDANNGAVFYTLHPDGDGIKLARNDEDCLNCHSSFRTQSVPGIMLRSIFLDKNDSLKSKTVTHRTPVNERWGSWYVTGNAGSNNHLGNIINSKGQKQNHKNISTLKDFINVEKYLIDQSDIVALMVLEHQAHMTNLITRANFRTRITLYRQNELNKDKGYAEDHISEYAMRDIARNGDSLIRYMLFSEEAPLNSRISGSPQFVKDFSANAVKDSRDRSLKDFNLKTRMFEYPCSYMIYSKNFDAMPKVMKEYVWKNLYGILKENRNAEEYKHLSAQMKKSVFEILKETKKGLPDYWK